MSGATCSPASPENSRRLECAVAQESSLGEDLPEPLGHRSAPIVERAEVFEVLSRRTAGRRQRGHARLQRHAQQPASVLIDVGGVAHEQADASRLAEQGPRSNSDVLALAGRGLEVLAGPGPRRCAGAGSSW